MSSVSTIAMPVATNSPDSADVLRLLTHTRRRISGLLITRAALTFLAVGCIQALVLISLASLLHGAAFLAALFLAATWPFAVLPFIHSRYLAGPIRDSGLNMQPIFFRLLLATRWAIPLSVLPVAAIVLFTGRPPLGLMAFDAAAVCLITGIWSAKLPTQKRIAWLVDQQAGLDGSLSLWLEMIADSRPAAGNPFYSLTWQRVRSHWQNICRSAAGLNSYPADQPRSISVLFAAAGFGVLAVGAGLLLADSMQSHTQSTVVAVGRVKPMDARNQPVPSRGLRVDSKLIHALPPSLAKRLLQESPATNSGPPAVSPTARTIAAIRQDMHQRQSWKKTLNALQAALNQKLGSEIGPTSAGKGGTTHTGNGEARPGLAPARPRTSPGRLTADLVQAVHHAGLSALARNRILAAARGFSGRAGARGQNATKSAIADTRTAQGVLARELSAERKLLAEIAHHMAGTAPLAQKPAGNIRGKSATALANASGNSGILHSAESGGNGLVKSRAGGPSEKPGDHNRTNAALVDGHSVVILDKPSMETTHHPIGLSPQGGGKTHHASPAIRPSETQNKTARALPAGYRRLIRRYFAQ